MRQEPFGPQTNSGFCNFGQPLCAMPRCVDGRTAIRNGPASIECFDPSHDSADIFRESQIAAAQFFQGAQTVLSVIHRLELAAAQQLCQLASIDPVALAAIFQKGVLARIEPGCRPVPHRSAGRGPTRFLQIRKRDSLSPGSTSGSLPVPIHRPALYSAWARSGAVGDVIASRGPHVGSPSRC